MVTAAADGRHCCLQISVDRVAVELFNNITRGRVDPTCSMKRFARRGNKSFNVSRELQDVFLSMI